MSSKFAGVPRRPSISVATKYYQAMSYGMPINEECLALESMSRLRTGGWHPPDLDTSPPVADDSPFRGAVPSTTEGPVARPGQMSPRGYPGGLTPPAPGSARQFGRFHARCVAPDETRWAAPRFLFLVGIFATVCRPPHECDSFTTWLPPFFQATGALVSSRLRPARPPGNRSVGCPRWSPGYSLHFRTNPISNDYSHFSIETQA